MRTPGVVRYVRYLKIRESGGIIGGRAGFVVQTWHQSLLYSSFFRIPQSLTYRVI